jgi:hypothetical protein
MRLAIPAFEQRRRDANEEREQRVGEIELEVGNEYEQFEKPPYGEDAQGQCNAPQHRLDQGIALELVLLFEEIKAPDDNAGNKGKGRQDSQSVGYGSGGMKMFEHPDCEKDEDDVEAHAGEKPD